MRDLSSAKISRPSTSSVVLVAAKELVYGLVFCLVSSRDRLASVEWEDYLHRFDLTSQDQVNDSCQ